jgi:hypothetical protein
MDFFKKFLLFLEVQFILFGLFFLFGRVFMGIWSRFDGDFGVEANLGEIGIVLF